MNEKCPCCKSYVAEICCNCVFGYDDGVAKKEFRCNFYGWRKEVDNSKRRAA